MNLRRAAIADAGAVLGGVTVPLARDVLRAVGDEDTVVLGLRPESVAASSNGTGIPIEVTLVEELGADAFVYGAIPGDEPPHDRSFIARIEGRTAVRAGATIHVEPRLADLHVFHPATGRRLG